METAQADADRILAAETARIRALIDKDLHGLANLLDESLVHVHATGRQEDRDAYLAGIRDNLDFQTIERGPLTVRVWGDVAVMTGSIDQQLLIRATGAEMRLMALATQVWIRAGEQWRLVSFHACACK